MAGASPSSITSANWKQPRLNPPTVLAHPPCAGTPLTYLHETYIGTNYATAAPIAYTAGLCKLFATCPSISRGCIGFASSGKSYPAS